MTTRRRIARRPGAALRARLTWRMFTKPAFGLVGGTNQAFNIAVEGPGSTLTALGVVGDYTIRRVRWSLAVRNNDAETGADTPVPFYLGMTVATSDAFASGVGALPSPEDDSADWFAYHAKHYFVGGTLTGRFEQYNQWDLDERSMRKVNENSQMPVLVFAIPTGETASVAFAGRILVSHGRQ